MSDKSKKCPFTHLTTDFGAPVVDNQNSMTAGARGPLLAQDLWLNEKLAIILFLSNFVYISTAWHDKDVTLILQFCDKNDAK